MGIVSVDLLYSEYARRSHNIAEVDAVKILRSVELYAD